MWRRLPDWLIYFTIISLIYLTATRSSNTIDAPLPPPELGELLPAQSPRDPSVIVKIDKPRSGIGTAFSIKGDGQWLTARHVVDSCQEVGLKLDHRKILRVNSEVSKHSDTAVLRTDWARQPLTPDFTSKRRIGEYGYFFGFPQSRPGEVVAALLGRGRLKVRGRYNTDEPILAWTEVGRTQGLRGSLAGLSGGPVLDADGEVMGVVAAESPRRGRVYSVAPRNLIDLVPKRSSHIATPIALDTYGLQADRYRRERRITQVICIVK